MKYCTFLLLLPLLLAAPATAANQEVRSIADFCTTMERHEGFVDFYYERKTGKLYLRIDTFDTEFLYLAWLSAGVGSNDLGLDRGQFSGEHIVRFERYGPKVLLYAPNYRYRAMSGNPDEVRAVQEAFAASVLWGFDIVAEEDGAVLVEASDFVIRDVRNVAGALKEHKEGRYTLDKSRSALYMPRCANFPRNTELEALLTFTGEAEGSRLWTVTPEPNAVTVRQRHSFVALPDSNYRPRAFDPRAGFFPITFADYAAPVHEEMERRYIVRHRLEKQDPTAAVSDALQPIVYYLDPGTPEPVRSALLDGARWWSEAFEAAGFRNAFRVEMLPAGADMMDVRYNVIQWVHRSTRGWSYGIGVHDPRTGEIINGHVSLGSLRFRHDMLIAEGLLAPYKQGSEVSDAVRAMALARLRQLAAHEIGHTLGLAHNFAASVNKRASVMDYPHPLIGLDAAGRPELSDAYAVGVGAWDIAAIRYGYTQFAPGQDEMAALDSLLREAEAGGLYYITDRDARPAGGAHPLAHLWDNGSDAARELGRLMQVRKAALDAFGEQVLPAGRPLAELEEAFAPIYFLHRYQLEAAVKLVGGLHYSYAVRGGAQETARIVAADTQREALEALLQTVEPEAIAVPEHVLPLLMPKTPGYARGRESFGGNTGITFDAMAAAQSAADLAIHLLLNPQRAARMVEYHARIPNMPGFGEVLDRLLTRTVKAGQRSGYFAAVHRSINSTVLARLLELIADRHAGGQVRAVAWLHLLELQDYLEKQAPAVSDAEYKAHYTFALQQIQDFRHRFKEPDATPAREAPPGSPIGMPGFDLRCECATGGHYSPVNTWQKP